MTREDAIYEIRQLAVLSTNKNIEHITEALNMAIEALTMQYGEWVNSVGKPIKDNHSVYCSICGEWSEYRSDFCPNCGAEMADRKTEPTISKMEQVDEPQTDTEIAKAIVHKMIDDAVIAEDAYPDLRQKMHDAVDEYEPQTDGYMTAEQAEDYRKMLDKAEHKVYGNIEDEPQTDCSWK